MIETSVMEELNFPIATKKQILMGDSQVAY